VDSCRRNKLFSKNPPYCRIVHGTFSKKMSISPRYFSREHLKKGKSPGGWLIFLIILQECLINGSRQELFRGKGEKEKIMLSLQTNLSGGVNVYVSELL